MILLRCCTDVALRLLCQSCLVPRPFLPRTVAACVSALDFSRVFMLGKTLGKGSFSTVFQGTLKGASVRPFAVKRTNRRGLAEEDREGLFEEVCVWHTSAFVSVRHHCVGGLLVEADAVVSRIGVVPACEKCRQMTDGNTGGQTRTGKETCALLLWFPGSVLPHVGREAEPHGEDGGREGRNR